MKMNIKFSYNGEIKFGEINIRYDGHDYANIELTAKTIFNIDSGIYFTNADGVIIEENIFFEYIAGFHSNPNFNIFIENKEEKCLIATTQDENENTKHFTFSLDKVDEKKLEIPASVSKEFSNLINEHDHKPEHKPLSQPFKFVTYFEEDHKKPIYGTAFCHYLNVDQPIIFATVGSNRVTIYECQTDGIKLLQCYSDPDINEGFFSCCWSYDPDSSQLILAAGGLHGIIRIIDPMTMTCAKHYTGHGDSINELKFHPKIPSLLLSASKDHSLRLWNIQSDVCVAIFSGAEGHRDQVLSADFDALGMRIMSCGMDHALKLWSLDKSSIKEAIQLSFSFNPNESVRPFSTVFEHFPVFSTRDVHQHYVDCVKWLGNFILSKATGLEDTIICWKPGRLDDTSLITNSSISVIHRFEYSSSKFKVWYIRFALDIGFNYMAVGNENGEILLWDLNTQDPANAQYSTLKHIKCNAIIRQTAFSRNGEILIGVCDDGTVWRWDKINQN